MWKQATLCAIAAAISSYGLYEWYVMASAKAELPGNIFLAAGAIIVILVWITASALGIVCGYGGLLAAAALKKDQHGYLVARDTVLGRIAAPRILKGSKSFCDTALTAGILMLFSGLGVALVVVLTCGLLTNTADVLKVIAAVAVVVAFVSVVIYGLQKVSERPTPSKRTRNIVGNILGVTSLLGLLGLFVYGVYSSPTGAAVVIGVLVTLVLLGIGAYSAASWLKRQPFHDVICPHVPQKSNG